MKLIDGIVTDCVDGDYLAVTTGKASRKFNGLIRNNKTADFLFRSLMTETTEDGLVELLLEKYDVTEEKARLDVRAFVEKLKEEGLLEE